MGWDWFNRWFKERAIPEAARPEVPQVRWLELGENAWVAPVLDVRPVTLGMISTSRDKQCAVNAVSYFQDDGTSFIDVEPRVPRQVNADLKFRIEGMLADGALFIPWQMEHKWALFFHRNQILCIRSWLRRVEAVADVRITGDVLEVTTLRGVFASDDEEPQFSVRVLDFLLRSHALDMVYPAPLPAGMEQDPSQAALWCFSCFGNRAHFATPHTLAVTPPEMPL